MHFVAPLCVSAEINGESDNFLSQQAKEKTLSVILAELEVQERDLSSEGGAGASKTVRASLAIRGGGGVGGSRSSEGWGNA